MLELVHALVGQLSRMRETVLEATRLAHRLGQLVRREATAALRAAVHRLTPVCAEQTSQHVIDGVWHHVYRHSSSMHQRHLIMFMYIEYSTYCYMYMYMYTHVTHLYKPRSSP